MLFFFVVNNHLFQLFFKFIFLHRKFGQFDYSQQGGYEQPSGPYAQQPGYVGTIMTPDPVSYNAESTDDFENEPPLMEGKSQLYSLDSIATETERWIHVATFM